MAARLIRAAAAVLAALAILLLGGIGLVMLAFDPDQYKTALIAAVRHRYDRALELPGTLRLQLLPPITLDTGPVRLSEPGGTVPFAQAADLRLRLDLLALLRHRVVVDRIAVDSPRLVLRRDAAGHDNFDDLLAHPAADWAAAPMHFDVHAMVVRDAAVEFHDAGSGADGQFDRLDLALDGLGRARPTPMHGSARLRLPAAGVDLAVALDGTLNDAPGEPLSIDALVLRGDGTAGGVNDLRMSASGALSHDASGTALTDLSLNATGRSRTGDAVELAALAPRVDWTRQRIAVAPTRMHGRWGREFDLTGALTWTPQAGVAATLGGSAGGSRVRLDSVRDGDATRTTVALDRADLGALVAAARSLPTALLPPTSAWSLGADQMAIGATRWGPATAELRADHGSLSATAFTLQGYRGQVAGKASLDLAVPATDPGAAGGTAAPAAGAKRVPTARVRATGRGLDAGGLLQAMGAGAWLRGRADADVDVRFTPGATATLAGTARVSLRDGALPGVDLAGALRRHLAGPLPMASRQDTAVRRLQASFDLASGVATTGDLRLDAAGVRAGGGGAIDLGRARVDLRLRAALAPRGPDATLRVGPSTAAPAYALIWPARR